MLKLIEKSIDDSGSGILFSEPFTEECLAAHWEIASGSWRVEDGWLTGMLRENGGGMIYTKAGFPGDVMIGFTARTVPPCRNDLNFVWNTEGWNKAANDAGVGYIGGLGGWWGGNLGLEHYPECRMRSTTSLFRLEAGRAYHVQAGSIGGHCFIAVDGAVALEAMDPQPIDTEKYNRVGLGVYCSHVQYRDFAVKRILWKPEVQSYIPSF